MPNDAKVKIFCMDDCEWWIGACTVEEALAAFVAEYGDDAGEDLEPYELSDAQLDSLRYYTGDEEEVSPDGPWITFREQLAIEEAAGVPEPRLFACTEW